MHPFRCFSAMGLGGVYSIAGADIHLKPGDLGGDSYRRCRNLGLVTIFAGKRATLRIVVLLVMTLAVVVIVVANPSFEFGSDDIPDPVAVGLEPQRSQPHP